MTNNEDMLKKLSISMQSLKYFVDQNMTDMKKRFDPLVYESLPTILTETEFLKTRLQTSEGDIDTLESNSASLSNRVATVESTITQIEQNKDTYTFSQLAKSAEWVIVHNLGKMPSVMIFNADRDLIVGDIKYDSNTQLRIVFSTAVSGIAYLN